MIRHSLNKTRSRCNMLMVMVMFLILPAGAYAASGDITTFAGGGAGDTGSATSASLYLPRGIHVTASGVIYIADTLNHRVRKIDTNGIITTVAGNGMKGLSGDGGLATSASLKYPLAIAVDHAGNIFIADAQNHRVRKVNTSGIISTIIGGGAENVANYCSLPAPDISNIFPREIFLDSSDRIHINDGQLWRLETDGTMINLSDPSCGYGSLEPGFSSGFFDASGAFIYASGNNIFRTTDMRSSTLLGAFSNASPGAFTALSGDAFGNIYVAVAQANIVYKFDPTGTSTIFAGTGVAGYSGDGGGAVSANVSDPTDVFADVSGNVYIADWMNHRIRKVDLNGTITTVAGTGEPGYAGDGLTATSERLNLPRGVFADFAGNVYIADTSNHRVRKIDTAGTMTTVAGNGVAEFSGDGGQATAAGLYYPNGVAVGPDGTIYIADSFNDRIRKVDSSGIITTLAGTEDTGYDGDGGLATLAVLNYPTGIALDGSGNIFIADLQNNAIRKIDTSGIISTYANITSPRSIAIDSSGVLYVATSYDGINRVHTDRTVESVPSCSDAVGVSVDAIGDVYMACQSSHTVIKASRAAGSEIIAGTGAAGFSGDGGPATSAMLSSPSSVFVDVFRVIYIADSGNNRIRRTAGCPRPSVIIQSPADGFTNNATPLLLYAVCGGTAAVQVDGIVVNKVSGNSLEPLADGPHTVRVEATNGYDTEYVERTFIVDTVIPTITLSSPTSGTTSDAQPLLTYSASEGAVAVKVDGVIVNKVSGNRLDTLLNGPHAVRVESRDAAGNVGFAEVTFTVASPPTVTIISPATVSTNTATPLLSYTAINGTAIVKVDGIAVNKVSGDNLDPLADGPHTVRVEATNEYGTGYAELTFTVDTLAPVVAITSPAAGLINNNAPLLSYAVSEGQVIVKVDGNPISKVSGENLGPLSEGSHVVRVEAVDIAGHLGFAEAAFTVDTIPPQGLAFTQIATGRDYAVGVKSDGTLWSWGSNADGQLGNGTTTKTNVPGRIGTESNWSSVAVGAYHSVALKSDGTLWAWGYNNEGQVGDGTKVNRLTPVQIGTANTWKAVAAGAYHTVALRTDGTLWAWGWNLNGQLGDGTTTVRLTPVQVGAGSIWVDVTAGYAHTHAIKADGTLWAWGSNTNGRLGDGTTTNRYIPTKIGTDNTWAMMRDKYSHNLALKSDGTLWAWGYNYFGQVGDNTVADKLSPVRIGTDNRWTSIAPGWDHSLAARADGTLWAWGYNYYGQVGDGSVIDRHSPVQIGSGEWGSIISAGEFHSIAQKSDKTLWAWGYNNNGQLGDGSNANKSMPVKIGDQESITVNNGASYTNTVFVTLRLTAIDLNGVSMMQFSNDGLDWTDPEAYATTKEWALDQGDGTKLVYVKFKDAAGNWSAAYSDSIVLDASAPTVTISSPTAGTTNDIQPLLTYSASDGVVTVKVDGAIVSKVSDSRLDTLFNGPHAVRVESRDVAGNVGFAEVTFTVAVPPSVTISSPGTGSTNNNTPLLSYTASNGTVVVKVDGMVVNKVSGGNLDPLADGQHTVRVEATDAYGTGFAERTFTVDATAPTVTITSPAVGTTADNQPILTYTVSDGTVTVKVDGVIANKVSGSRLYVLSNGPHTVRVESGDAAGNIGFGEVSFSVNAPIVRITEDFEAGDLGKLPWITSGNGSWTVKSTVKHGGLYAAEAPQSIGDSQSATLEVRRTTASDTISFWYSVSSEANYDFLKFYMDGVQKGQWSGTVPWTQASYTVSAGAHTFKWVYSKDISLSTGSDTAWIDDIVLPLPPPAPSVTITSPAAGFMNSNSPVLNYTVSGGAVIVKVDGLAVNKVSGNMLDLLADGTHIVRVEATDANGTGFAEVAFTVDTAAPAVAIASPVVGSTHDNAPTLTYTVSDGIVMVKVDGAVVSKVSGDKLAALPDGTHTVRIESTDAAGNIGFAEITFVVDTVAPTVSIASPVAGITKNNKPLLTYTASDGVVVVKVDGFIVSKTSGNTIDALPDGQHTVRVEAVDAAGNTGFAEVTFVVDTISPIVSITSPAPGLTLNNRPPLTYTVSDGTVVVKVDGIIVLKVSGNTLDPLPDGLHAVRVESTDAAGNMSFAEAVITVDTVPPTLSINPVATPTKINNQTVTGNRESGANVAVAVNTSATVGSVSYPSSTTWSCTVSGLAETANTIIVTATDAAGNSAAATSNITYDSTAPIVTVTSPAAVPTNDNTPLLNYTVSDGTVVVRVDGAVVSKVTGDSFDTLSDGSHTVRVESTDAAGNTGFATVTFTVDTVPPAISINPVVSPTRNTTQTVTGTRESAATVTVQVNTSATVGSVSYPTATTWSCTISNMVRGVHVITAIARDAAGNEANATRSITVK